MSKTALIIGTSHSEATCHDHDRQDHFIKKPYRWHDYLESHGFTVTNLSTAGCTAHQQFLMIWAYLQDHPDSFWDLVLVEGRSIDTAVAVPLVTSKNIDTPNLEFDSDYRKIYQFWQDDGDKKKKFWPMTRMDSNTLDSIRQLPTNDYNIWLSNVMKNFNPWFVEYVNSTMHGIDTWCVNRALCDMLIPHSRVVRWFARSFSKDFYKSWDTDIKFIMGHSLMKDFLLADAWPSVNLEVVDTDLCACYHLNESGHKKMWLYIEERLKKENII